MNLEYISGPSTRLLVGCQGGKSIKIKRAFLTLKSMHFSCPLMGYVCGKNITTKPLIYRRDEHFPNSEKRQTDVKLKH